MRTFLLALTVLPALVACKRTDPAECDMMAVSSVMVHVVDQNGAPLVPSEVYFTVDGGAPQSAECLSGADCTEFVAGWERAGTFVVTANYNEQMEGDPCCWYDASASAEVTVGESEDGCHVETEMVTLTLDTTQLVCADAGDTADCG